LTGGTWALVMRLPKDENDYVAVYKTPEQRFIWYYTGPTDTQPKPPNPVNICPLNDSKYDCSKTHFAIYPCNPGKTCRFSDYTTPLKWKLTDKPVK
jgi:hypothetical protein